MQLKPSLFAGTLLLNIVLIEANFTKRPIFVHRVECINQPYFYADYVRCGIRSQRNQSQQLVGEILLSRRVQSLHGSFHIFTKHQLSQTHFYGTEMNLCQYLANCPDPHHYGQRNIVAELVMRKIHQNFPYLAHPCPYEGLLNLTGTEVRMDLVPPYIIPGSYVLEVRLFDDLNQTVVHIRVLITLVVKGIFTTAK